MLAGIVGNLAPMAALATLATDEKKCLYAIFSVFEAFGRSISYINSRCSGKLANRFMTWRGLPRRPVTSGMRGNTVSGGDSESTPLPSPVFLDRRMRSTWPYHCELRCMIRRNIMMLISTLAFATT